MGRKAKIHEHPYNDESHLPILDSVEQTVVRYRWGMTTGSPLTVPEVAEKMGASPSTITRLEKSVLKKIEDHIMGVNTSQNSTLVERIDELIERIDDLDQQVSQLSAWVTQTTQWQKSVKVRRRKKK